jgi:threonine/homoserine/homoserine lactone efflux protein
MAAGAVLIVTPGPDTALVLRTAAVEGPRRGAYTAAGICFGLLFWGLSAVLGIAAVLAASHLAYRVLRVIGDLTNPKVGVFFVTFLPQFVPPGVAVAPFIALLLLIHVVLSVIWLGFLIAATRSAGRLLQRPAVSQALDRVTGAVLIGVGLRLAAEGRR